MKRLECEISEKGSLSSQEIMGNKHPKVTRPRVYEISSEDTLNKSIPRPYSRSKVPRIQWSNELHQIFENVVKRLGGVERATPKMVLQMMDVKGVTVSHIKSHLQMCRSMKKEQNPKVEMVEGDQTKSNNHCIPITNEDAFERVMEVTSDQINGDEPPIIIPNLGQKVVVTQDLTCPEKHQQEDYEYYNVENVDNGITANVNVFKDFLNTGFSCDYHGGHEGVISSSSNGSNMDSTPKGPHASSPKDCNANFKNFSLDLTLG